MLQELYADAGNIDTLFLGSSHCYRSVDPAQVDAALGTHSFNAGSSQQLPDGSYYMLKEAAAQNPLKTVYLEMFYTGYNESASANIPLACYLLADHMDWRSPNRYAYLSEMGGLAAYADLLLPARHGIALPSSMPAGMCSCSVCFRPSEPVSVIILSQPKAASSKVTVRSEVIS